MNFEELIDNKNIAENSKKTYTNIIKRLQKDKFKFPIKDNESLKYVTQFLNEYPKLSTQLDLLNVIIIIRQELDKPVEKLKELRMNKREDRLEENITTMKDLKDNLMSVEDFENQLNQSFDNSNFTKYVLNYLMFHFGVRNKDLNVFIVTRKKDIEPDKNYLLVKPKGISYIRNDYKTFKTYGRQEQEIDDPRFLKAVKKIGNGPLLKQDKQLTNLLKNNLINNMTESKIFKMLIGNAYDKKDTSRVNELSKSRGTSIPTIMENYNVNQSDNVFRKLIKPL